MTEQELRALVRDAIARHAGRPLSNQPPVATLHQHPSHGLFAVPTGADTDGPCVIEPTVQCTHCGYCKSYGH
jgi:hypothetical protein